MRPEAMHSTPIRRLWLETRKNFGRLIHIKLCSCRYLTCCNGYQLPRQLEFQGRHDRPLWETFVLCLSKNCLSLPWDEQYTTDTDTCPWQPVIARQAQQSFLPPHQYKWKPLQPTLRQWYTLSCPFVFILMSGMRIQPQYFLTAHAECFTKLM